MIKYTEQDVNTFFTDINSKYQEIYSKVLGHEEYLRNYIALNLPKNRNLLDLFDFVFESPFEDLPMYINDDCYAEYVKWRIKIGK